MDAMTINSPNELPTAAQWLLEKLDDKTIIIFNGEMGAGKTTLIKEVCNLLGVKSQVTSPTYALVNEYDGKNGPIYHMDLFRLKKTGEVIDTGIAEYVNSGYICLIEWPDLAIPFLPDQYLEIKIENNGGPRIIEIYSHG